MDWNHHTLREPFFVHMVNISDSRRDSGICTTYFGFPVLRRRRSGVGAHGSIQLHLFGLGLDTSEKPWWGTTNKRNHIIITTTVIRITHLSLSLSLSLSNTNGSRMCEFEFEFSIIYTIYTLRGISFTRSNFLLFFFSSLLSIIIIFIINHHHHHRIWFRIIIATTTTVIEITRFLFCFFFLWIRILCAIINTSLMKSFSIYNNNAQLIFSWTLLYNMYTQGEDYFPKNSTEISHTNTASHTHGPKPPTTWRLSSNFDLSVGWNLDTPGLYRIHTETS